MQMYGWDTIDMVTVEIANAALARNASALIPGIDETVHSRFGTFRVVCTFGTWQIATGGSGQLLTLSIPVETGWIGLDGAVPEPLGGHTALFRLYLDFLPAAPAEKSLKFDIRSAGGIGDEPKPGLIAPLGFVPPGPPDPVTATVALQAMAQGLVRHASKISFAFAEINLVPPGTDSWLAPRNLAYSFAQAIDGRSYLAILSTAGDPAALPRQVDAALMPAGTNGSFAFSIPLYFENALIPSIASRLPGNPVGAFGTEAGPTPEIVLKRPVDMNRVKVGAIWYTPRMTGFVVTPRVDGLAVTASGDCDVYAGLHMYWSARATDDFFLDRGTMTIGFRAAGRPDVRHDVRVPWYWWALSPLIAGIANGVAALIAGDIADMIGGQLGSGVMSAMAPTSIEFAGTNGLDVTSARFDGAVILAGHSA